MMEKERKLIVAGDMREYRDDGFKNGSYSFFWEYVYIYIL